LKKPPQGGFFCTLPDRWRAANNVVLEASKQAASHASPCTVISKREGFKTVEHGRIK
jgi:hypothetical protein